jgi:phosphopantetheine--protein transferase-like protein
MNTLEDFIKNLTGREGLSLSNLTSAQKARAIAWARKSGVSVDEVNKSNPVEKDSSVEWSSFIHGTTAKSGGSAMVGIDMQSISEFFPISIDDLKSDKSLLEIFTISEIAYAESKDNPLKHLTGIFSLKEAIMKASGVFLNDLSRLEIIHEDGNPTCGNFSLSISYTGDLAVGVALSVESQDSNANEISAIHHRVSKLEKLLATQANTEPNIGIFIVKSALTIIVLGGGLYYLTTSWPF